MIPNNNNNNNHNHYNYIKNNNKLDKTKKLTLYMLQSTNIVRGVGVPYMTKPYSRIKLHVQHFDERGNMKFSSYSFNETQYF